MSEMGKTDESARRVEAAMVEIAVNVRMVAEVEPHPDELDELEGTLAQFLEAHRVQLWEAALEPLREIPNHEVEIRVRRGSIEVLVIISCALAALRMYNEFFAEVEKASQNTRSLVERFADAVLAGQAPRFASPPGGDYPQVPRWYAQTTSRWWLTPAALAATSPPVPAPSRGLPPIDFRRLVIWLLGGIAFLTALFVVASILLEAFAD